MIFYVEFFMSQLTRIEHAESRISTVYDRKRCVRMGDKKGAKCPFENAAVYLLKHRFTCLFLNLSILSKTEDHQQRRLYLLFQLTYTI